MDTKFTKLNNRIIVILGPTATGKTDLALQMAKKFSGELISCDSRQVYKGLDIGTGKMPTINETADIQKFESYWIINGIKIWLYDVVNPKVQYTVADYVKDANKAIKEITNNGNLPIIVGGSGLYLKALLYGLSNLSKSPDFKLRNILEGLTLKQLQDKLHIINPHRLKGMNDSDRQNPRRLIRAIEISSVEENNDLRLNNGLTKKYQVLKIGLTTKREDLYSSVDKRVIKRINQGMIDEAKRLEKGGLSFERMNRLGLEYGVLGDYLQGNIKSIEGRGGLIEIMQNRIHGYVRRQITWFTKEEDVFWFDTAKKDTTTQVVNLINKWYHISDDTKD